MVAVVVETTVGSVQSHVVSFCRSRRVERDMTGERRGSIWSVVAVVVKMMMVVRMNRVNSKWARTSGMMMIGEMMMMMMMTRVIVCRQRARRMIVEMRR